jgi:hypothetical protein
MARSDDRDRRGAPRLPSGSGREWLGAALLAGALVTLMLTAANGHAARSSGRARPGTSSSPTAVPTTAPAPAPILFGAYVAPRGGQSHSEAVTAFEQEIGRTLAIVHAYHGWKGPLIGDFERWAADGGRTLLISWKAVLPTSSGASSGAGGGYVRWKSIANGDRDRAIEKRARELRDFGSTVYLVFHHEPEDERDLTNLDRCGSRQSFRNAFRHIHDVFEREGATNVRFVLALMGSTFKNGSVDEWYPGDDVVDVVAADAYNWFGTDHAGSRNWTSFTGAFQAAYDWATARGKPFWVTETGTLEDPADRIRKAQWYLDMGAQAQAWPNLRALVYFTGGANGWYPDSSAASLQAFRQVVQDPYFGGTG